MPGPLFELDWCAAGCGHVRLRPRFVGDHEEDPHGGQGKKTKKKY